MWQLEISPNYLFQLAGFGAVIVVLAEMGRRHLKRVRLLKERNARLEGELDALNGERPVDTPEYEAALTGSGAALPVMQDIIIPTCEKCAHWDLEEGQAQFAEHPAFTAVTQMVSPAKMSQHAEVDHHGNLMMSDEGELIKSEPGIPYKAKWTEFGACSKHSEARWKNDKCDQHSPRALPPMPVTPGNSSVRLPPPDNGRVRDALKRDGYNVLPKDEDSLDHHHTIPSDQLMKAK